MTENLRAQGGLVAEAGRQMARATDAARAAGCLAMAAALRSAAPGILAANADDLAAGAAAELGATALDRLCLDGARLEAMANGLELIATLADPIGEIVAKDVRPNGLRVSRVRTPLGVVGVIYENRPNVTSDVAGLCIRSANAAYLRGSASALRSNHAIVAALRAGLAAAGLPADAVALVADPSHEVAIEFMKLREVLDVLVPRGGPSLIASMLEHATVPVILDGDGNCHIYVDQHADLEMATSIVVNAKTQRPGVCNAMESLVLHRAIARAMLDRLAAAMPDVELRGDAVAVGLCDRVVPATEEDFATEFLGLICSVAVVEDVDGALGHIARYGSGHSEAIITEHAATAQRFLDEVDAAAVLHNASTRFVDGSELGLGAEVGISTQKLHARGPMGLEALTSIRWVIQGEGQTRS